MNRKRIERLWRQEGLKVARSTRKRRGRGSSENGIGRRAASGINDVWAWDSLHARDERGRALKWLTLIDEHTRECLAPRVARSIKADDAIDTLCDVLRTRGTPRAIRGDNGPEFIARGLRTFLRSVDSRPLLIDPGSPWQNGFAESFHARLRDELIDLETFENAKHGQALASRWRDEYNNTTTAPTHHSAT